MRLKRIFKRMMIAALSVALILLASVYIYMQHPKFGKAPSGKRLERIEKSPNFKNGQFQNESHTPTFADGHTFWGEVQKIIFNTYPDKTPSGSIPSIKTDLLKLSPDSTYVIWFGHSSCFIQIDGKKILVDPVFSKNASPIPGTVKAFQGATNYTASDMPPIDYLLITHDHYDHLDYETVLALKENTQYVICGLGVGAHFEHWGYRENQIKEMDWREHETLRDSFSIQVTPARHKSGRSFKQNNTLWVSFLIKSPSASIFISGDGGYGHHFAEIGEKYGPIDLAIMETGQYDSAWHFVHLLPEEVLNAARDLQAKKILPVHHSKFVLARHPWYEPLEKIVELSKDNSTLGVETPMIGQPVSIGTTAQHFTAWWRLAQQ